MASIIAITSNKGGTGKTTIALGLTAALAQQQQRVLLIDMDQQGNATSGSNVKCSINHHVCTWLRDTSTFEQAVQVLPTGIHLMPAGQPIIEHEQLMSATRNGIEWSLAERLEPLADQYDFIVIDCPPNLGVMTFIALTAATYYIVPMQGENFAYLGLESIQQCVIRVKARYNPNLRMAGIVLNKFQLKTRYGRQLYEELKGNTGIRMFDTRIRQCIALMECGAVGETIYQYDPDSTGAADMTALAYEVQSLDLIKTIA